MGSEIAEYGDWACDKLLSNMFADRCDPGDGGVVDSLMPQLRCNRLESHPLPNTVRFYTLLAFSGREHIAQALLPGWVILALRDPRNDGQLTIKNGTWPGSTQPGCTNHWGVAIDIAKELNFLADKPEQIRYPHYSLFEASLRYVSEGLRNRGFPQAAKEPSL